MKQVKELTVNEIINGNYAAITTEELEGLLAEARNKALEEARAEAKADYDLESVRSSFEHIKSVLENIYLSDCTSDAEDISSQAYSIADNPLNEIEGIGDEISRTADGIVSSLNEAESEIESLITWVEESLENLEGMEE